jgi:trehalose/maltose hydrolase-like predicted phosphorylase
VYPGLLLETANFWVSRVEWGTESPPQAHIRHVICPDEYATGDDSVYTNYVAKRNLLFSTEAAVALGRAPDPEWTMVANALPILFDEELGIHTEYRGYSGQKIKQADVVLLGFPLMMNMSKAVRKADLSYYAPRTDPNGPAMTWGMHAVALIETDGRGDSPEVASNFNRSFGNAQPPFLVWTETPTGGTTNFLTGVGGFLQTILFGLPGLRVWPDRLALQPLLVEGMEHAKARGVHFRGVVFTLAYDRKAVTLSSAAQSVGTLLVSSSSASATVAHIPPGKSATLPPMPYDLRVL